MFKNLKLSSKIIALNFAIIIGFTAVLVWIYPQIKTQMYSAKSTKTEHLVESAYGVIERFAELAESGKLSEEEAKNQALSVVKNMRYANNDYFWINNSNPTMIMHPTNPDLDGKDLSNFEDPNGKRFFSEMVQICKQRGQGFVEYEWAKPGKADRNQKYPL